MAAGFKKATVNASDVPATQTDFPSYVDLSRVGITTLAEAQSVRVYADSGKATEWAREIVSATEMHVKIPSLTSTVEIFVDWDGVSADYAVTDTYGRNAVWSDYRAVHHLDNVNDSTANGYNLTNNNTVTFGTGLLGNAADTGTGNTNKYLSILNDLGITGGSITQTVWVQMNAEIASSFQYFSNQSDTGVDVQYQFSYDYNGGTRRMQFTRLRQNVVGNDAFNTVTLGTTWHKIDLTYDGTTVRSYIDGVAGNTVASSGNGSGATIDNFYLFAVRSGGAIIGYASCKLDESRIRGDALSANWLTTEYNNQSDEAGFWGTWSDVGSTFTPTPMMHHMAISGGLM